jgi:Tfp pilus assembly protein PilV
MLVKTRGDRSGFTVAEILVTAAVILAGLLAVATLFPSAYATATRSGAQARALALAQQQIERLRTLGYDAIAPGTTIESSIPGYAGYTRTTDVLADAPITGARLITVTVTLPGATDPIQLTTVAAR